MVLQRSFLLPYESEGAVVYQGDAYEVLKRLPSQICQTAVTSPPYWGLRDYELPGQIGAEEKLEDYIERLVWVFRELRRVLRDDGTLWLNLGDCYTSGGRTWRAPDKKNPARAMTYRPPTPEGLKPKDLVGVPWRVAMALQSDGWYLRSEIIWHKPNPLPESVKDRPTRAHETIFLLSKTESYFYDHEAIQERGENGKRRNKRSVWTVPTEPFKGAHFATFPPKLIEPCILAGSRVGDTVIDPFFGSGTTGLVAALHGRRFIGIELKSEYIKIARKRLAARGITFEQVRVLDEERNA
ncbi:MAG: site-specific DNA-methyltransferase [Anaerolineae bacterium]|nr:site-specific DNA-methyltransferase [Anaerolineae bacterium]